MQHTGTVRQQRANRLHVQSRYTFGRISVLVLQLLTCCRAGFYRPTSDTPNAFSCPECEEGGVCDSSGTTSESMGTAEGWWRPNNRTVVFHRYSSVSVSHGIGVTFVCVGRCFLRQFCTGGSTAAPNGASRKCLDVLVSLESGVLT